MLLDPIKSLVQDDLLAVDDLIANSIQSKASIINNLGQYIVQSGGKRLRPLVVLLTSKACGYTTDHHIPLAAIIEFIHTATILHDDVVDESKLRRGKDTANAKWGNEAAVLVGDYLYSKAFQMLVSIGNTQVMDVLANATSIMAEGEVLQLLERHNIKTTETDYLNIIRSKTAKLFEASAQIAAILAHTKPEIEKSMAQFGMHLGTAFQLIDDVLDYEASNEHTGKTIGNDLAEGKVTLPLIYLLQNGTKEEIQLIQSAIQEGGYEHFPIIQEIIHTSKALEYTRSLAKVEIMKAKEALLNLSETPYREALYSLADFALERNY